MTGAPEGSKDYPAIRFIIRFGHALAIAAGIAALLAGLVAWLGGAGWGWTFVGLLAAPILYMVLRGYAELVSIIADTLLPR